MNSAEAREYVRLATTETKGRTKTACDLLIDESVKLEKIKQIINTAKEYRPRIDSEDIQAICEVLEYGETLEKSIRILKKKKE